MDGPHSRPATRVLATLGPACSADAQVRDLVLAGASAFRINFSHGDHDTHRELIATVRRVGEALATPLAIVGDLCGPKLRTGTVADDGRLFLEEGELLTLVPGWAEAVPGRVGVNHLGLDEDVGPDDVVLLDDGRIALVVTGVEKGEVTCRVTHPGALSSRKGINVPGVRVNVPALTERDLNDVAFAVTEDIDFLALSFVQEARDVVDLKRRIAELGASIPVIAKIEKPLAYENLEDIVEVSDGIMVARGDLGVEMGHTELPVAQKRIILTARKRRKLVITATQMLDSMTRHPHPTRAEVSDVANAIFDGTDVVMLSQETAIGDYPTESVRTMQEIARNVEASEMYRKQMERIQRPKRSEGVADAAVEAACVAAERLSARAVIPFSDSGWTAFNVAAWRPVPAVYACTHRQDTWRRLALAWGLRPFLVPESFDLDDLYVHGMKALLDAEVLDVGDLVVVLTGSVVRGSGANTIKIYRVGTGELTDDPKTRARLKALGSGRPRPRRTR